MLVCILLPCSMFEYWVCYLVFRTEQWQSAECTCRWAMVKSRTVQKSSVRKIPAWYEAIIVVCNSLGFSFVVRVLRCTVWIELYILSATLIKYELLAKIGPLFHVHCLTTSILLSVVSWNNFDKCIFLFVYWHQ